MKKTLQRMKNKFLLIILFLLVALIAPAQTNIRFTAMLPVQDSLTTKLKYDIKEKVDQILTRNNAANISPYNSLIVESQLTIEGKTITEGLVQNTTTVTGELTLVAKNRYDDRVYGTLILEVSGEVTGNENEAVTAMISNVKANSPVFARFIRNARQLVREHYGQGCESVLAKARTMLQAEQFEETAEYLLYIPETSACYEEAVRLAETAWAGIKNVNCDEKLSAARSKYELGDYQTALELLNKISSSSPCHEAAAALIDTITTTIVFPEESRKAGQ